jgi:hypothetical protein
MGLRRGSSLLVKLRSPNPSRTPSVLRQFYVKVTTRRGISGYELDRKVKKLIGDRLEITTHDNSDRNTANPLLSR